MQYKYLLIFFTLFSVTKAVKAQGPIITADSTEPYIGERFKFQSTHTNSVHAIDPAGANMIWDYSNLKDSVSGNILSFVSPIGLAGKDSFPNANLALISLSDTSFIEYCQATPKRWGLLGAISLKNGTSSYHYTIPMQAFSYYPIWYKKGYADTVKGVYLSASNDTLNTNAYQIDSVYADGYGTLKLPNATYTNVVRLKETVGDNYLFVKNGYHFPLLITFLWSSGTGVWNASYYAGSALPLQITSFNGKWENKIPSLQWTAANLENTKAFIVQRSFDGRSFTAIGEVSSSNMARYQYEDMDELSSNIIYYRLKQLDKDGQTFYSNTLQLNKSDNQLSISPNPARDFTIINFGKSVNKASIEVYDATGKMVSSQLINSAMTYQLNTKNLNKGIYIIKIKAESFSYLEKLVIIK